MKKCLGDKGVWTARKTPWSILGEKGRRKKGHYLPGATWDELLKLCDGRDSCMYVCADRVKHEERKGKCQREAGPLQLSQGTWSEIGLLVQQQGLS